jgi:hypothetical protein
LTILRFTLGWIIECADRERIGAVAPKITKAGLVLLTEIWKLAGKPAQRDCFVTEDGDDIGAWEKWFVRYKTLEVAKTNKRLTKIKQEAVHRSVAQILRNLEEKEFLMCVHTMRFEGNLGHESLPHGVVMSVYAFEVLAKAGVFEPERLPKPLRSLPNRSERLGASAVPPLSSNCPSKYISGRP